MLNKSYHPKKKKMGREQRETLKTENYQECLRQGKKDNALSLKIIKQERMPQEHMVVHSREAECEKESKELLWNTTAKFLGRCALSKNTFKKKSSTQPGKREVQDYKHQT